MFVSACRACDERQLIDVADLGHTPYANTFPTNSVELKKYPLKVVFCQNCGLAQLSIFPDLHELYGNYIWHTSSSSLIRAELEEITDWLASEIEMGDILEVAANDGLFVGKLVDRGFHAVGLEPAENMSKIAKAKGLNVVNGFFEKQIFEAGGALASSKFDLIIARNVFAHVASIADFFSLARDVLNPGGHLYVEFHDADALIRQMQFDSIYHEHQSYITEASLRNAAGIHGFEVKCTRRGPIGGGSLGILLKPLGGNKETLQQFEIDRFVLAKEREKWVGFSGSLEKFKDDLHAILNNESSGHRLVAFGASARSTTLINVCQIQDQIDAIVDSSSMKWGKYWTGTKLIVGTPDIDWKSDDISVFLTAWNFKEEIFSYLKSKGFKGRVIMPLPVTPTVVEIG